VYRTPVHIDENRRRSSPWQIISETLAAQNEDGTPRYPLTLSTESLATKVLTREENGEVRAYGVEYLLGEALYEADRRYDPSISGEQKTVMARKEVIVAGGAFNTPQILKLSGIGPRAELEVHNIPVVADLRAVVSHTAT
jgi:choline dehydrogenase